MAVKMRSYLPNWLEWCLETFGEFLVVMTIAMLIGLPIVIVLGKL